MLNYERRKTIKKLLIDADLHQADIARSIGVSVTAISDCLKDRLRSQRLRQAVAEMLGTTIDRLWPETKKRAA